jgi:NADH-quinone oxidoreductase subunit N
MKEIVLISLLGIAILGLDILNLRKWTAPFATLGLAALIVFCVLDWNTVQIPFEQYGAMLTFDTFSYGFTIVFSALTILWIAFSTDLYTRSSAVRTDILALVIFSLTGAVVLTSYSNLVMLFLGVEMLSIPLYVLASSERNNVLSNEAGFKYFFMGSLASAVLLFGIALLYGGTGTFVLPTIADKIVLSTHGTIVNTGITMILAGLIFKISAFPFHMWVPDVYQGAPTAITAFMSSVVKGAAFAALAKFVSFAVPGLGNGYESIFLWICAGSLLVANLVALVQQNLKRMLAYSGISHAAFMLGAVICGDAVPEKYLMYYVLVYGIASMLSLFAMHYVAKQNNGSDHLDAFTSLLQRSPVLALTMTAALFSMAGVPPLAGFLAKYYVMSALMARGFTALTVLMVITSAVGAYYYIKWISKMFVPAEPAGRIYMENSTKWLFAGATLLLFVLFLSASLMELL